MPDFWLWVAIAGYVGIAAAVIVIELMESPDA